MSNKRKIVRIEYSHKGTRVFLDDGSELTGLVSVDCFSAVNNTAQATISAYVYPELVVRYQHIKSGETVSLTEAEAVRFFDNRNPFAWRKVS